MRWSYRDKLFPQRISRNFETLTVNRWNTDKGQKAGLKRWWHNIGRTMSEFCIVNKLWKSARIEVEGLEHLKAAQAEGAPVIFTSMHLGTWEALLWRFTRGSPDRASVHFNRNQTGSRTALFMPSAKSETSIFSRRGKEARIGCTG